MGGSWGSIYGPSRHYHFTKTHVIYCIMKQWMVWFFSRKITCSATVCIYKLKQGAHGPHRSPEKTVQIHKHICSKLWLYQNIDLERGNMVISFLITEWSLFVNPWVSFTKGCFVPNFVEIGSVDLEKKIFKFRQCIFTIS